MRAVLKFLNDLNNNLQPFLEPALLPVVARTITASIPPLIVPSLGVRSLFFNTGIISVDMKTRLDLKIHSLFTYDTHLVGLVEHDVFSTLADDLLWKCWHAPMTVDVWSRFCG